MSALASETEQSSAGEESVAESSSRPPESSARGASSASARTLVACHRERGEDPPSMCNFVLNKLKTQGARLMESVAFEILLPPEASVAEPLGVEADAPGNAAHGPARIPAALPARSAPYGPARTAAVRDVPAAEGSLMWGDVVGNEDC